MKSVLTFFIEIEDTRASGLPIKTVTTANGHKQQKELPANVMLTSQKTVNPLFKNTHVTSS